MKILAELATFLKPQIKRCVDKHDFLPNAHLVKLDLDSMTKADFKGLIVHISWDGNPWKCARGIILEVKRCTKRVIFADIFIMDSEGFDPMWTGDLWRSMSSGGTLCQRILP